MVMVRRRRTSSGANHRRSARVERGCITLTRISLPLALSFSLTHQSFALAFTLCKCTRSHILLRSSLLFLSPLSLTRRVCVRVDDAHPRRSLVHSAITPPSGWGTATRSRYFACGRAVCNSCGGFACLTSLAPRFALLLRSGDFFSRTLVRPSLRLASICSSASRLCLARGTNPCGLLRFGARTLLCLDAQLGHVLSRALCLLQRLLSSTLQSECFGLLSRLCRCLCCGFCFGTRSCLSCGLCSRRRFSSALRLLRRCERFGPRLRLLSAGQHRTGVSRRCSRGGWTVQHRVRELLLNDVGREEAPDVLLDERKAKQLIHARTILGILLQQIVDEVE